MDKLSLQMPEIMSANQLPRARGYKYPAKNLRMRRNSLTTKEMDLKLNCKCCRASFNYDSAFKRHLKTRKHFFNSGALEEVEVT